MMNVRPTYELDEMYLSLVKTDRHKLGKERIDKEQHRQSLVREHSEITN